MTRNPHGRLVLFDPPERIRPRRERDTAPPTAPWTPFQWRVLRVKNHFPWDPWKAAETTLEDEAIEYATRLNEKIRGEYEGSHVPVHLQDYVAIEADLEPFGTVSAYVIGRDGQPRPLEGMTSRRGPDEAGPGGSFLRRYVPPQRHRSLLEEQRPSSVGLPRTPRAPKDAPYAPMAWRVLRVAAGPVGPRWLLAETDDEQRAIQTAVQENERLQAESAARTDAEGHQTSDRPRGPLFDDSIRVSVGLPGGWDDAYQISANGEVNATAALKERLRMEWIGPQEPKLIRQPCPKGCAGELDGTQAQWEHHLAEHERVKGMGKPGLREALTMASRNGDGGDYRLYAATWRSEYGQEPPAIG
ncbi:hypothetical protein [Thermomonospora umbrina]|uniref:Uncharacterized protein n=1 Tax=Thermomonospora umbrina TaxID=111806 RepID=A0A3D9T9S8_9ACTN|nr:hypothetical protein [Thermomonospora umbrina]REF00522.1 hypothetical protein DFJ69_6067 [Thermomonospora umbrina]